MDPNWNDLQQELKEGTFADKGFSKQLQLHIEHKMELKQTILKARFLKLAVASAAVLLIGLSLSRFEWRQSSNQEQTASAPTMNPASNENKPLVDSLPLRV